MIIATRGRWQVAVVLLTTQACARDGTDGRRIQSMKDLESDSPEVRRSAVERILQKRDVPEEDIRTLADKHLQGQKKGTARDAILLLGRLGSRSSVPWLLDHLTVEVFYKETKRPQPPADRFPAVQALVDIGLPSIKPLLAKVSADSGVEIPIAAAAVLIGILGARGAAQRLKAEVEATSDAVVKAAMQRTLESVNEQSDLR